MTVVWGGWHPSLFPTETLRDEPAIDVSVQAQGEETFVELAGRLSEGSTYHDIKGIAFRNPDGQIVKNPGRPLQDVNLFPMVNYDLIDVEKYFRFKKNRQFDYISSAGCRFRCTFCASNNIWGHNFRTRSVDNVVEEVKLLIKTYKVRDFVFHSDTINNDRKWLMELCKKVKDLGIRWECLGRVDALDEDFELIWKILAKAHSIAKTE